MKRLAISPVVASIILSAMVLVVGAGVWSYSQSAASVMAYDYANNTVEMVNTIQERYTIEHASFDHTTHILSLWVYNYGDVKITTTTQITIDTTTYPSEITNIGSNEVANITFDVGDDLPVNEEVSIYIITKRGNSQREIYYVE